MPVIRLSENRITQGMKEPQTFGILAMDVFVANVEFTFNGGINCLSLPELLVLFQMIDTLEIG